MQPIAYEHQHHVWRIKANHVDVLDELTKSLSICTVLPSVIVAMINGP